MQQMIPAPCSIFHGFGPLVGWIIGALEGAVVVGGLSALGAGLYSMGIPKDSVVEYETALKSDNFLVMAHGTVDEVAQAKHILETTGAAQVDAHQSADTSTRGAALSSSV